MGQANETIEKDYRGNYYPFHYGLRRAVFGFGFFVYWHINICGLLNAKAILIEGQ